MARSDLLRAVHPEDDLVREPVRHEVRARREDEAKHQALRAAEHLADSRSNARSARRAATPSSIHSHSSILASTAWQDAPFARAPVIIPDDAVASPAARGGPAAQQAPVPQPFPGPAPPAGPTQPAPPDPVKPAAPPTASPTTPPAKPPATPQPRRQPRRAALSRGAVPRIVRRGPRPAVLPLWHDRVVRGDLVTFYRTTLKQQRRAGLRRARDPRVRGRPVPRRDDGVSAERDDQGLPVGDVGGLPEPQTRRQPARFPTIIQIVPTAER